MADLLNNHLVNADAVKTLAPFGTRPGGPGQGPAAGGTDHALAWRCAP